MDRSAFPGPLGGEVTYADRSVAVLREMILDGRLAPGERLNEVHLSQALGISRGPLREGLRRLSSAGLIDIVPHRGAYVASFTPLQLRELYELRIALECHAARLIAEQEDRSAVTVLAAELDRAAEQIDAGDSAYPPEQDFHGSLLRLAGSGELLKSATSVAARIGLARSKSANQPSRARAALDEHRAVLTALAEGDADEAARLLRAHLTAALENALALLASES